VSPVRYELGFYIPEDGILHSDRREHLKSYTPLHCMKMPLVCGARVQSTSRVTVASRRSVCPLRNQGKAFPALTVCTVLLPVEQ
jgi:hypothetical protein